MCDHPNRPCVIRPLAGPHAFPGWTWDGEALGRKAASKPATGEVWIDKTYWESEPNPVARLGLYLHEIGHLEGANCEACADRRAGQWMRQLGLTDDHDAVDMFLRRIQHRNAGEAAENFHEGFQGVRGASGVDAWACPGTLDGAGLCKAAGGSCATIPGLSAFRDHAMGYDMDEVLPADHSHPGGPGAPHHGAGPAPSGPAGGPHHGGGHGRDPQFPVVLYPGWLNYSVVGDPFAMPECPTGEVFTNNDPRLGPLERWTYLRDPDGNCRKEFLAADDEKSFKTRADYTRHVAAHPLTHCTDQRNFSKVPAWGERDEWSGPGTIGGKHDLALIRGADADSIAAELDQVAALHIASAEIAEAAVDYWPQNPRLFAWLLAGIGWIESHWGPALTANLTNAAGTAYGWMQIYGRSHPEMIARVLPNGAPAWKNLRENVRMGAEVLAQAMASFPGNVVASTAAYNAGVAGVSALLEAGLNPDAGTEDGRYAQDVFDWITDQGQADPQDVGAWVNTGGASVPSSPAPTQVPNTFAGSSSSQGSSSGAFIVILGLFLLAVVIVAAKKKKG